MKALDMFFLILTVVAIPALRIWQVTPWRATSPLWDKKQAHNLLHLAMLVGLTVFMGFAAIPWWVALILLLPILVICAWSISAAYDWKITTNIGQRMDNWTWAVSLKTRALVVGSFLALLAITWIAVAIIGAFGDGSASQAQPPTTSPTTQAPATTAPTTSAAPTTQATSPAPSPSDSTSATASSKQNCMDDIPVDKAVKQGYGTTLGNTLDVCRSGKDWANIPTTPGTQVKVLKWAKDGAYEYDLITLNGKQVWIRVPL